MDNFVENSRLNDEDDEKDKKIRDPPMKLDKNASFDLPSGLCQLESQVAGHRFNLEKNPFGMLRESNDIVLKSGGKKNLKDREIDFYEEVVKSDDPVYKELSRLIPEYCGTRELDVMNKRVKLLALRDITSGMSEPCVMDIKIGKRTWDPLAGPTKRASEDRKYTESKNAYGFSITGFQVYDSSTSSLKTFNKEYGRTLNAKTVIEALEIFLNVSPNRPPCRELVIMLLSSLWKIQAFFRTQKKLHFYSSSILIVYDAKRLRQINRHQNINGLNVKSYKKSPMIRTYSFEYSSPRSPSNFSPLKNDSLLLTTPVSAQIIKTNRRKALENSTNPKKNASEIEENENLLMTGHDRENQKDQYVRSLCRTHSFDHNYERDIIEMKEDYAFLLDELTGQFKENLNWVRVNMIDFTHVFPAENNTLDINYLEGIESLIKILESFYEQ